MIRTILVATDGSEYGAVATRFGIHLAQKLKARLSGLYVLDSRLLEGPLVADISGWIGAQPVGTHLSQFKELLQNRGETVLRAFQEECRSAGIVPETSLQVGHPSRVILKQELKAELLIIGQKGEHAGVMGDMMGSNADRISRNSIKPCMIVGPSYQPITNILAAYDGSPHSSQALQIAVELAESLSTRLHILTVCEHADGNTAEQISQDGARIAAAHDVEAIAAIVEGHPKSAILEHGREIAADLTVVGAHGHGRIREMFLGSTTTHLITHTDIPVMLVR